MKALILGAIATISALGALLFLIKAGNIEDAFINAPPSEWENLQIKLACVLFLALLSAAVLVFALTLMVAALSS